MYRPSGSGALTGAIVEGGLAPLYAPLRALERGHDNTALRAVSLRDEISFP